MQVHIGSRHYTLRDEQITAAMEAAKRADDTTQAWQRLERIAQFHQ